jgi:hypothetical protein
VAVGKVEWMIFAGAHLPSTKVRFVVGASPVLNLGFCLEVVASSVHILSLVRYARVLY